MFPDDEIGPYGYPRSIREDYDDPMPTLRNLFRPPYRPRIITGRNVDVGSTSVRFPVVFRGYPQIPFYDRFENH